MRCPGEERTTELPLTQDMITQLAVEAAFRGVPICELIGDLITEILQAHARKEAAPVAEAKPAEEG
jgi:pyruvate/2-oxoglutarate/acetoin dehydrogenase E1 component